MGGRPLTHPKVTFLCHFNLIWPKAPYCLVSWGFSFCWLILNLIPLLLHMLRNYLFHSIALSILGGPPPPPTTPERGGVKYCFVLFLNSANNRRNDIVCTGCTCFPKRGWGGLVLFCFFFPLHPHSPFILPVPPLLFGGNVSDSCFLSELPIPGNLEILPRGAQRRYCFIPPPPPHSHSTWTTWTGTQTQKMLV